MKRIILIILIIATINPTHISARRSRSLHQPARLLIELHSSSSEFEQDLARNFPHVTVIERFDTLINGMAIEGKLNQLIKITENEAVKSAYPIMTYSVDPGAIEMIAPEQLPQKNKQNKDRPPFTGKGVKVGVIDTGIDYTHPDLEANFKGGYDLVDFDDDPMETTPEQGMPTLHGTHVAGIIAANGHHQGVAPDAEIYGYRALGPGGMGTSVQVIAALEKAVNDGMDIINLSLGNNVNGPDYPTSIAVNRAIELGTTIVIANGNAGPDHWTVGSPATATEAISVGASTLTFTEPILKEPVHNKTIDMNPITNAKEWDLTRDFQVISGRIGTDPLPDATNKIVLFERGEITFQEKITQAEKANARAVLIYNNSDTPIEAGIDYPSQIPAALISKEAGEWLLAQFEHQPKLYLSTSYQNNDNQIAGFSSRGPVTANWQIKPEVVAPGVDIISTVPNGYASLQGTSMAAPYVTGVLAVLKEAYPDWSPAQLKAALLTQSDHITEEQPIDQGMGQVNLEATLTTPVIIEQPIINLGWMDERIEKRSHSLKITNVSDQPLTVRFERPPLERGITWRLPLNKTISPNQSKNLNLSVQIRPDWLEEGMHQDYLTIMINDEAYKLPYLFINQGALFDQLTGFEIQKSLQDEHVYHVRLQLAEPSDRVIIDLYDSVSYTYIEQAFSKEEVDAGLLEVELDLSDIDRHDQYLINISVEKAEKVASFQRLLIP